MAVFLVSGVRRESGDAFCFGYYESLGEADRAVRENLADLTDGGLFDHVVVEELPAGLHRFASRKWWYRYDGEAGRFVPCPEPEEFRQHPCVAVGQDFRIARVGNGLYRRVCAVAEAFR
ncbi:MAG: hypothetical protein ACPLRW_05725 [Moorellales bacterium]